MADDALAAAATAYCVCRQADSGIMIECIRGTGGCNGWVHPPCCGLVLTHDELEAIDSYICPLCESPTDDYSKMKALNTALANKQALKMRRRKEKAAEKARAKAAATKSERPWRCGACGEEMLSRSVAYCTRCAAPRPSSASSAAPSAASSSSASSATVASSANDAATSKQHHHHHHHHHHKEKKTKAKKASKHDGDLPEDDSRRRRSGRESNKARKNYHVPNSDEDLESDDEDPAQAKKKRKLGPTSSSSSAIPGGSGKKRKREAGDDDDLDADSDGEAEFEGHWQGATGAASTGAAAAAASGATVAPTMVIEKIMGTRRREVAAAADASSTTTNAPPTAPVTEYYIKWKGFSYLHCSWETREVLLEIDPANKLRIKRFHEKEHLGQHRVWGGGGGGGGGANGTGDDGDGDDTGETEYFNPEYLEIHRILAQRQDPPMAADPAFPDAPVDDGRRYLVKWRVLPYTDATWERACDLTDDAALAKYEAALVVPPKEEWEPLPRPTIREYRKLDESPTFGADHSLKLRAYQLEGLNWLLWNWYNERPSILADEMGLGKTIQTLAFLDRLRWSDKIRCRGPFLVVAPLSLIAQWQSECETWTTMNCVVYHGNTDSREIIRDYEFYYLDHLNRPDKKRPFKFNILVTTYEVAIKDIGILSKIRWRCLVVDEAHRLKNQASRLVEQLRSLRRDHCVLLTGTPLQNKTEELWALLNFLDAKSFPSVTDFLDKFGDLHEAQQVADLHKMLKPYLLRRVKEDVEKSLPPKEETIIEVELTPVQKQWYRAIYERNTAFLSRGGNPQNMPNLMNVMMELRKCCNHPYLNNGVEERLIEGLITDAQRHEMMVKCCGKMVLLDKLLPRLKEGGHKVLIFSQMVRVLDIIEDYLRYMGYIHERLDGNIRGNDRQAAVDRFVKPEYNRFVMLLSTKAGGLGLNLTAADTVIIFDSDWNPQNDLQAQARAHRIGQTHSVKIYRLITSKTYEMHMFHKASLKLGLDKAVLTHMRRENEGEKEGVKKKTSKAQEAKEIDELLKRGAYDVFRDDDNAGEQFCAADIDQILQRSSQIVQYEQQAKSSFSKASFVSATTSDDVDIDDPDFWKKAVGLTEPDPVENEDALPLQRKRTRVSRFGTSTQGGFDSDEDDDIDAKKSETAAERKERERAAAEEREREEKREPRDWTLNGRDRLQRALMHFGVDRWEIIRSQSGGSRTVDEVERFAREFIYACALACADSSAGSSKDDTSFIKSLIKASAYAQKVGLVDENEMSQVLKDDDFVVKLKQGGGRRVLIRLDMLWRLRRLVVDAVESLDEAYKANPTAFKREVEPASGDKHKDDATAGEDRAGDESASEAEPAQPPPQTAEIDDRVAFYGVNTVSKQIKIAEIGDRPSWTQITPWWDDEADRNLLIGVFLHGYGRCSQILGDPRLRFAEIAQAAEARGVLDGDKNGEAASATMSDAEQDDDDDTNTVNGDDEPSTNGTSKSATSKASSKKKDTTSANKDGAPTATAATVEGETKSFKQPEVQQMNRLLFWLLSAEDLKRQKELEVYKKERTGVEQQRQVALERKQRAASLHRVELKAMQLAQLDMFRHLALVRNSQQMPEPIMGSKIKPKDWTKEERRTLSYLLATHGAPRILAKTTRPLPVGTGTEDTLSTFAWETDSLSWMNFVQWGKLNKTAEMVRAFYEIKHLPKCHEIASMKVDPLGTDQRAVALADLVGIEFVDAHEGVLAHGLKAQNLAWVTLRRAQLFDDILTVLGERRCELTALLRSGRRELVDKMPVWWCPWIHDVAVFEGMARYGIGGWVEMLVDRRLPLHRRAREEHIRVYFLEGRDAETPPLYQGRRLETDESRAAWLREMVDTFPSLADLERKVHGLCLELLHDVMADETRYDEPPGRAAYSFPLPGNAVEETTLRRARETDRVLRNPFLELTHPRPTASEDWAAQVAAGQGRRDAFLARVLGANGHPHAHTDNATMATESMAATAGTTTSSSSPASAPTSTSSATPPTTTPRHSIPIHMLVS